MSPPQKPSALCLFTVKAVAFTQHPTGIIIQQNIFLARKISLKFLFKMWQVRKTIKKSTWSSTRKSSTQNPSNQHLLSSTFFAKVALKRRNREKIPKNLEKFEIFGERKVSLK
jgi:hypothetical protein